MWLLFAIALMTAGRADAQDLFDYNSTLKYAQYLMRGGNYEQAGLEYQRLVFLKPENDTFKTQLLRAYRLGNDFDLGIKQWQYWKAANTVLHPSIQNEYAKTLIFAGKAPEAIVLAATPGMLQEPTDRQIQLYGYLLLQDWTNAALLYDAWPSTAPLPGKASIGDLFKRASQQKYKKPWLAAGLSAVLPGSGKAYTKDWADGAIALVFVGLNTWQTYRRFDKEGLNTFWGWFHGGFAAGFYIGNIYGSHKAARLYNQRQKHKLQHETERLIYPVLR